MLASLFGGQGEAPAAEAIDSAMQLREKLKRFKQPGYPAPDDSDATTIAYLKSLSGQTDQDAQARYRQGAKNLLYMFGSQYLTYSRKSRNWEVLPLIDERESRVVDNCILPALRARSQRLLSGPVQFDATPKRNDLDARDRARLGAEWVQSRWKHTNMVQKVDQALTLGFCCGVSCLKSFWNRDLGTLTPAQMQRVKREPVLDELTGEPQMDWSTGEPVPVTKAVLGDDGQPVIESYFVDEGGEEVASREEAFMYRPGDTDTAVRSIFNIRINPDATAWDAGAGLRWLLDTDELPVETAKALFPEFADQITPSAPEDTTATTMERLAAGAATVANTTAYGGQRQTGPQLANTPTTVIQEYWELPNHCFPKGRLIVRVGQVKVFDGDFPDGVFPYTPIFDEPAPLTPMGRPSVNDVTPLQDTINRQWNAIDAEARMSGVGRWVAWELPGVPDQLTPEDKTVIQIPMNGRTANRSLKDMFYRLDPAQAGGDRWKLLDAAKRALQDILAFHEVSRGQVPPGVDSGVAIQHLLEEERGQLAKAIRALETSLIHWAGVQLAVAKTNYGDQVERWLASEKPDLGYILETVDGMRIPDPDELTIELQGFKPQNETAFKAEVKEALGLGLLEPREARQLLELGRGMTGAYSSQTRHYQRARWINLAIERGNYITHPPQMPVYDPESGEEIQGLVELSYPDGSPFVLPDDDDHVLHMQVLDDLILNDQKPQEVRQAAQIVKGHRRRILEIDLAPPPAPDGPPPEQPPA